VATSIRKIFAGVKKSVGGRKGEWGNLCRCQAVGRPLEWAADATSIRQQHDGKMMARLLTDFPVKEEIARLRLCDEPG
jgi:hypothetical protein